MKHYKPWVFIVCLLMLFSLGQAKPKKGTFTLEQVMSAPYPRHLVSAKKADRIAWVFYTAGKRNVWTAAAPDFLPVNLTDYSRDEVFEIPSLAISDDGSIVVYVRGGNANREGWVTNPKSDPDGVEQAVWAVKTDGGNPWRVCRGNRPVVSPNGRWILLVKDGLICRVSLKDPSACGEPPVPERLFKAAGRNGSPVWSPDGKQLAFVSSRNDHSFVGIFDIAKRKITWMAPSVDRDGSPAWTADGRHVVFARRPGAQFNETFSFFRRGPSRLAVWIGDAGTGEAHPLWTAAGKDPQFYSVRNLQVTQSGRILFTGENDNWNHVYSMPLTGGDPVDLTPGEGAVEHIGLSSDGKELYYSCNHTDLNGRHIWKVPTAGGKAVPLTKGSTIGTYPVALASGRYAAFLYSTARHPLSVALVASRGGDIKVVAPRRLPPQFPIGDLVIPKLVSVKAEDGLEIFCQLFLPKGAKAGDGRPGIVYTHGGPIRQMLLGWHYMEFYSEAYGINQYLANQGYVVISINYRSGIMYGRSFRNAPKTGQRGASEYQDVVAGAKYLQSRPEVDPDKVGLWGLSYGGLLTAMGLARNSDIFKVGVDLAGVHDWSQMRWGRLDPKARKIAFESSPVASIDLWKSPVLIIQGDDDRNVPFSQSVDLVQKLRAKGDVHVELMICPDEPHEFLLYKNRMDGYHRTCEFLARYLGKK